MKYEPEKIKKHFQRAFVVHAAKSYIICLKTAVQLSKTSCDSLTMIIPNRTQQQEGAHMIDAIHLQHERFTQTYKDPSRKIDVLARSKKQ